jgi:hypothetical protein
MYQVSKLTRAVCAVAFIGIVGSVVVRAEAQSNQPLVTMDNFAKKETHLMFHGIMQLTGGIGEIFHYPVVTPIDKQAVVRSNRDTLYSGAVLDLTEPVILNLPDTDGRYLTALVINEGHYAPIVFSGEGSFVLSQEIAGSRYASILIRTMVDAESPEDMAIVHELQKKITIDQADKGNLSGLPVPHMESLATTRDLLRELGANHTDYSENFGAGPDDVNMVHHLIGSAISWGGWAPENATYIQGTPENNDGETPYTLTLSDVPVADDAFWSVTVYNDDGYMSDQVDSWVVNSQTATTNDDGSITINFSGDTSLDNNIQIVDEWNYLIRLYKPSEEYFSGEWTAPTAIQGQ